MKLILKLSLALLASVSLNNVSFAQDFEREFEEGDELFAEGPDRRGCKKVKCLVSCGDVSVGGNLSVRGNESIGGNLTVGGSITASSFALAPAAAAGTAGLPGVGGMLAWGEIGRDAASGAPAAAPTAGQAFGFDYTNVAPAQSGMTGTLAAPAGAAGLIIETAGVYIFQYQATNDTAQATVTSIQLLGNGNSSAIPHSLVSVVPGTATSVELNGFVISFQPAGALIQLQLVAAAAFTFPAVGIGAKLTAMRIS